MSHQEFLQDATTKYLSKLNIVSTLYNRHKLAQIRSLLSWYEYIPLSATLGL